MGEIPWQIPEPGVSYWVGDVRIHSNLMQALTHSHGM